MKIVYKNSITRKLVDMLNNSSILNDKISIILLTQSEFDQLLLEAPEQLCILNGSFTFNDIDIRVD